MALLDNVAANVAKTLIGKFGKSITYRETTSGAYNPGTLQREGDTDTDYAVPGVVSMYSDFEADGTTIQVGDRKVLVARTALTPTPDTSGKMVIDSVVHHVVRVTPTYSGDNVAMWEFQVRV